VIPRYTPLKRSGRPKVKRSKPRRRATPFLPEYRAWISTLPCLLYGHPGERCETWGSFRSEAAHVRTRRNNPDAGNLIPLCHKHHFEQHAIGVKSFGEKYGLDLSVKAEAYWIVYQGRADEFTNG
jgi:hypothetical protein